ncbi:AT hook motif protein [Streptomyces sp. NPDC057939]|uniref:AT hook motif protein n=1 Tax=Streptomyces sp. NPDC057939 TaxID=3346284 RepID=UPI0036E93878
MSPAGGARPGGEPDGPEPDGAARGRQPRAARPERKQVLLRLDPQVYDALTRWAGEELRSANAQIEFLLRRALSDSGRLPGGAAPIRPRGRPRNNPEA